VTQAPVEGTTPTVTDEEQDYSEQELVRREKLDRLKEAGADPYPVTVPRTATLAEVVARHPDLPPDTATGDRVGVTGRIIFMRNTGKLCFAMLREGDAELPMLPTFSDPAEASEIVRWFLAHDDEREKASLAIREAVAWRTFDHMAAVLLQLLNA